MNSKMNFKNPRPLDEKIVFNVSVIFLLTVLLVLTFG